MCVANINLHYITYIYYVTQRIVAYHITHIQGPAPTKCRCFY